MIEDAEAKVSADILLSPSRPPEILNRPAAAATVKGYRMIPTMPETMSVERRNIVKIRRKGCSDG